MSQETDKIIRDVVALLWTRPFKEYLSSSAFTGFLLDHGVHDEWQKFLDLGRDNPAFFGGDVEHYAFTRFLEHLYHHLPQQFPALFSGLLADYSRGFPRNLPVDGIRMSFLELGYPAEKTDPDLIALEGKQVPGPGQ